MKEEMVRNVLHCCQSCSSHTTITEPHIVGHDSRCDRDGRTFDLSMECDNREFPVFCTLPDVEEKS